MKTVTITCLMVLMGVVLLFAAELTKKEPVEPCMKALEEIAEEVNDQIYPE